MFDKRTSLILCFFVLLMISPARYSYSVEDIRASEWITTQILNTNAPLYYYLSYSAALMYSPIPVRSVEDRIADAKAFSMATNRIEDLVSSGKDLPEDERLTFLMGTFMRNKYPNHPYVERYSCLFEEFVSGYSGEDPATRLIISLGGICDGETLDSELKEYLDTACTVTNIFKESDPVSVAVLYAEFYRRYGYKFGNEVEAEWRKSVVELTESAWDSENGNFHFSDSAHHPFIDTCTAIILRSSLYRIKGQRVSPEWQ